MDMKRNLFFKWSLLVLSVVLVPQACTNLDEDPNGQLTGEVFPKNAEQYAAVLGAAYTSLYGLQNHGSYFSLQETSSDEACIPHRGADWFDGGQWLNAHRHKLTRQDPNVSNAWNFLYSGVARANAVIKLFTELKQNGEVPAADADANIAEMRTLRALYYFWLMDAFGNVPVVIETSTDPKPATVARKDVYAFVEKELNESVASLSKDKSFTKTYGRMTYWAGKALQSKLYLNAQVYTATYNTDGSIAALGTAKWAEAYAAANDIITNGGFTLENDYFANFNTENQGSAENILAIPYDEKFAEGFNLPQMTLHYQSQFTFSLEQQPWNGYCTKAEFYNSYEDVDKRKGLKDNQKVRGNFIAGKQYAADGLTPILDGSADDPDGAPIVFTPEINQLEPGAFRQAGARIGKFEFKQKARASLSNDFPIFRYADILLVAAEALWHINPNDAAALGLVNQVRQRAGVGNLAALDPDNLLAERGREMFYEGWRRQDLIRFGKYGNAWFGKPAETNPNVLFPVPLSQLQANPNLKQNPGYN